ncbi:MAG: malonyl- -acyl carrier transacylase [Lasallia pustulata]|uniref:[acyl-carrier-protein] S-malonyltransferase n=1 Tax=Lasallia pustulata TaxID=136370 RepID=A0A5M8PLI7_9LECA|nr:MAG: malonyl- -acyl carrier transacylase [Lasallia pustulata]
MMQRSAARSCLRQFGRECSPSGSISPARPISNQFISSVDGALLTSKKCRGELMFGRWASTAPAKRSRTALFFPGQGVQRLGMIAPWLEAFPRTCKPFLEEMDHALSTPLSRIIEEGPNSTLMATENAQPAIMATSIMILRVLEGELGFKTHDRVDVTLGHSLGEFAALVAGGYLNYVDALKLVRRRAEAMARCSREASLADGGEFGMVALVCEPGQLSSLIRDTRILGHSSPV